MAFGVIVLARAVVLRGELELYHSTTGAGIPKWAVLLVKAITSASVSKDSRWAARG
jgi:hypothetical protein